MQQEGDDPTVVTGRLGGHPAGLGPGPVGWLLTGREVSEAQHDKKGSVPACSLLHSCRQVGKEDSWLLASLAAEL